MDLGDFAKLIVPGIVLVLWALNQLFGKEDAAAQNRQSPFGPKPGNLPPAPRPRGRQQATAPAQATAAPSPTPKSWSNGFDPLRTPAPNPSRPAERDDILVIGPEAGRPGTRRGAAGGQRRGSRSKPATTPERRGESPRGKALIDPLAPSMTISPLSPAANVRLTDEAPRSVDTQRLGPALDLGRAFGSPERLREAFLLQLVLGPPKALQDRRLR